MKQSVSRKIKEAACAVEKALLLGSISGVAFQPMQNRNAKKHAAVEG